MARRAYPDTIGVCCIFERVSLNTLVVAIIAEGIGARSTHT